LKCRLLYSFTGNIAVAIDYVSQQISITIQSGSAEININRFSFYT